MNSSIQAVPLYRNELFLREHYVEKGLNIAEISRLTVSSRVAVRSGLKSFGIPIRRQDELPKNKSQLRYGEVLKNRELASNRREQQTIRKMQRLRANGFSYHKIAAALNALGVPTKTRHCKWHARSIQKVLDDNCRQRCPLKTSIYLEVQ